MSQQDFGPGFGESHSEHFGICRMARSSSPQLVTASLAELVDVQLGNCREVWIRVLLKVGGPSGGPPQEEEGPARLLR
jgi:hypothetical protein